MQILSGAVNWADLIYEDLDFEVSPALWALMVGPLGFAMGWEKNMTSIEVCLGTEESYMAMQESEAVAKEELKGFVDEMRA